MAESPYLKEFHLLQMVKGLLQNYISYYIVSFILYPSFVKEDRVFKSFIKKHLKQQEKEYCCIEDFKDFPITSDVYCTGSDQTWNSGWNNGILPELFLKFVPDNVKRISYAASIGKNKLDDWDVEEIKALLSRYQYISVREASAKDIIEKQLGLPSATHVLDPTLQVNKEYKLFAKYLIWLGGKMRGKIIGYDFRDKSCGWGLDYMTKTKTKTKPSTLDPYYYHFLKGTTYRECCYRCNYCTKERVGDITIGDYWGIGKEHPEFYSTKGVSCLLVNSKKGERLWSIVKDEFETLKSTFEQVAKANHNLTRPTQRTSLRDVIYQHIDDMEVNEYFATQLKIPFNLKARIKLLLPKGLKVWIKKHK